MGINISGLRDRLDRIATKASKPSRTGLVIPGKPKIHLNIRPPSTKTEEPTIEPEIIEGYEWLTIYDAQGNRIRLDDSQIAAVEMIITGRSFVLVGAAGTGKTTTVQSMILAVLGLESTGLTDISYRIQGKGGYEIAPSIALCAATNKAVRNMYKKVMSNPEIAEAFGHAPNVTTLHNLLEYSRGLIYNPELGRETMQFFPSKVANNQLEVTRLIVEEGSMIGVGNKQIWDQTYDAMQNGTQVIILGDINQLPPVGGKPLLAYAIKQLPIVELTTIHRQAQDNPIICEAYNVLKGIPPVSHAHKEDSSMGVKVLYGKKADRIGAHKFKAGCVKYILAEIDADRHNPYTDMILVPYYKQSDKTLAAFDMNNLVANHLAKKEDAIVWEIRTGFQNIYIRVGEMVVANKVEGKVIDIKRNPKYTGRVPQLESTALDYWGLNDEMLPEHDKDSEAMYDYTNMEISPSASEDLPSSRAASHIVTVMLATDELITLRSAGDFADNVFSLGYALSVHRSQGSEWPRVIFMVHDTHFTLRYREVLYTAMTRAAKYLTIIAQKHTLDYCTKHPRIKGHTLADKLEFFNSGYLSDTTPITKGEFTHG